MAVSGFIDVDVHGLYADEAVIKIEQILASAPNSVYRVRVIHGYHRGTSIRSAVRDEFDRGRHPRVIRVEMGGNEGITELVLREY